MIHLHENSDEWSKPNSKTPKEDLFCCTQIHFTVWKFNGKHDYISLIRKQQLAADYTLKKYAFIVF